MTTVNPAALAALARKYQTLGALRRARASGEPPPARAVFRELAREFPGALRELDVLELGEIDRRAAALGRAAAGVPGAYAPWMAWLDGYHAWMRAALALKLRVGRVALDDATVARLAHDAATRAGLAGVDAVFVRAVASPPGGRLGTVVLARLAAIHGVDASHVRALLGPTLRDRASGA